MPHAVIAATARSPIGRAFKGSLTGIRADDLLAQMIDSALNQIPQLDRHGVEDVIVGTGSPWGEQGYNVARVAALLTGMTDVPGTTVNRYCASSLQAIRIATHAVRAGEGDAFVAAGVECVSRYEGGLPDAVGKENPKFDAAMKRSALRADGAAEQWRPEELPDAYVAMGQTAENVAQLKNVSRADMDQFALASQQRAAAAVESGFFAEEITPVALPDGGKVVADDSPRPATTLEGLAGLKPVFRPDGTVTAGNSCPLNDGAAATVVMNEEYARAHGITPIARIRATAVSGLDPEIMGLGPVQSCRKVLDRAGMSISDVDLFEINEAFAAQVLPCMNELGIPHERLNVHGGAIALGHPFGMTGARIMNTLLHGLEQTGGTVGLEAMCVGGGQGMAIVVERV
jgi:acetyl-CoA C-acetyltransferase